MRPPVDVPIVVMVPLQANVVLSHNPEHNSKVRVGGEVVSPFALADEKDNRPLLSVKLPTLKTARSEYCRLLLPVHVITNGLEVAGPAGAATCEAHNPELEFKVAWFKALWAASAGERPTPQSKGSEIANTNNFLVNVIIAASTFSI